MPLDRSPAVIRQSLQRFLARRRIRHVHFAGGATPPPPLAYLVNFPRLSVILDGQDDMQIELHGRAQTVRLRRGDAVFVPANCWNNPAWRFGVTVLTLLFGKRQTGVSLVCHGPRSPDPKAAFKTHFHRPPVGLVSSILDAMGHVPHTADSAATARHLIQALLRGCLNLLDEPNPQGKANRSFHAICLYLQENFHSPLTRSAVARHFGLSPNHVSRLFRAQGLMKFADYVTWVRLDRAKFLLRNHPGTIADIAAQCGFADPAYFNRVFRRRVKVTPGRYRLERLSPHTPPARIQN
ncbi:MAG TPA: helix-turn-helix domain-containing protein [Tepidisphaeraceae bacterium]|nr:helix-turn-helix domain-containing protein [Tepidisphaeraceae bacterium]